MAVNWKDVYSDSVSRVGFDTETREMLVEWKTGKVSGYVGVEEQLVDQISRSVSVGGAIHSLVKGKYGHRYR